MNPSPIQANLPTVLCSPMLATHHLTTLRVDGVHKARVGYLTDLANQVVTAPMAGEDLKLVYGSWYQQNTRSETPFHFVGGENGPGVILFSRAQQCLDKQLQNVTLRSPTDTGELFNVHLHDERFTRSTVDFKPFAANGLSHNKITSLIQGAQLYVPLEDRHLTVHTIRELRKTDPTYLIVINKMRLLARWQGLTDKPFISAFYYSFDRWVPFRQPIGWRQNQECALPGTHEISLGGGDIRIFAYLAQGSPGLGHIEDCFGFSGDYYAKPVKQNIDFLRKADVAISGLVDSLCDLAA
ncbi:MAG: hypothetical protein ABII18_07985 [bacterium]|nr:hypothetical protein [bacterium]MBU1919152.1 hypothetical protein [bacterium]